MNVDKLGRRRDMLRRVPAFVLLVFIFVIGSSAQTETWVVKHAGGMRAMFDSGDVSGKTVISDLPSNRLYGVGPLAGLKGEILIWNGKPFVSKVNSGSVIVERGGSESSAVFFVWSNVRKWTSVNLPSNIKTYSELEAFIATTSDRLGVKPGTPFPFKLVGQFGSVRWHVNDYKPDGTKLTRAKHDADKYFAETKNKRLLMLGFFSTQHTGIFIHHTHSTHIHVTDRERSFVGHVDDLEINGKIKLYLPLK